MQDVAREPAAQGAPVSSTYLPRLLEAGERFDVIVVGSEPEGVMAAVAAAEEGARTLLVSEDTRLGGLFVLGELNSLDVRTTPQMQRGLFERWWAQLDHALAFDVAQAERVFAAMLQRAAVSVRLGSEQIAPLLEDGVIYGVSTSSGRFLAHHVIDATADGDLAAAAGAAYSVGFASLGLDKRMADTLVFKLRGVNWARLKQEVNARGGAYAHANGSAIWGTFGGYPAAYRAEESGIRLRGLNLGVQSDGSVLVNALLVYGVDPFDASSVADGVARARREAPRIVRYLRALPGFERATLSGTAEKLYLRETRHIKTHCTLSVDDALGNVVTARDVAAGNYPLDVQSLTETDHGFIYGVPRVYGAQLCMTLPESVQNLWIVGKAAGFDPLAASSARVVPFGMALAEAVGVASADAAQARVSSQLYSSSARAVARVRERLVARGAYLPEVTAHPPSGPFTHPHFGAYRTLRQRGLALGGYHNDPQLDARISAEGFLYLLSNVGTRFYQHDTLGSTLLAQFPNLQGALTQSLAYTLTRAASCELSACLEDAALPATGEVLTRGEAYSLAAQLAEAAQEAP